LLESTRLDYLAFIAPSRLSNIGAAKCFPASFTLGDKYRSVERVSR
jgi:hypothetical protein